MSEQPATTTPAPEPYRRAGVAAVSDRPATPALEPVVTAGQPLPLQLVSALRRVDAGTPWWRNPVAVMGYAAQVFGVVMVVASVVIVVPGEPAWVGTVCGVVLAVGSKLSLDDHSAKVRAAELHAGAAQAGLLLPANIPGESG